MLIDVVADRHRPRRWLLWLLHDLETRMGQPPRLRLVEDHCTTPRGLEALLAFERMIGVACHGTSSDDIAMDRLGPYLGDDRAPDLVIDLTAAGSADRRPAAPRAAPVRTLAPLYDGAQGETALWHAIIAGQAPWLELADSMAPAPVAIGLPAIEMPHRLGKAADCVLARMVEALVAAAARIAAGQQPISTSSEPRPHGAGSGGKRAGRAPGLTRFAGRALENKVAHLTSGLTGRSAKWHVGWRRVPDRRSPAAEALRLGEYQILPDDGRRFFADPFVIFHGGCHHVFVEELPFATGRGIISHFMVRADGTATTPKPVLDEPHHLSYPHVFEHKGQMWMIPESPGRTTLDLYRADPFPHRWVREGSLIEGSLHDATLTEHGGKLWIFAAGRHRRSSTWDTLHLYSADSLTGPWSPHPLNPVVVDVRAARPAGELFRVDGNLWRPVQDCSHGYGSALRFARVTRLDSEGYAQETVGNLHFAPSTAIAGPHTLNWTHGLEVIDLFGPPLRRGAQLAGARTAGRLSPRLRPAL